ncbi:MAG: VCBS repeat-containing protein, partial [Planctomycetes bacterium]|nr:VCBS repeat-containing protein [Planctomycetota bacterium]
ALGRYRLLFDEGIGQAVHLDADAADLHVQAPTSAARSYLVSVGDINLDGYEDFVAWAVDTVGTISDLLNTPATLHPQEAVAASYATIVFGGPDGGTVEAGEGRTITLKLPAPVTTASFGTRSVFAGAGDFNGGGDDLAVLIASRDTDDTDGRPAFSQAGLYILFGRQEWPEFIDLTVDADAILTGFEQPGSVASPGDFTGNGYDDLVVTDDGFGEAVLLEGGADFGAGSGVVLHQDFQAGAGDFTATGLWHLSTGRAADIAHSTPTSFYFGQGEAPSGGGTYNTGSRVQGVLRSGAVTLTETGRYELSFRHFLQTEGYWSDLFDRAEVLVSLDGGAFQRVAVNWEDLSLPLLPDGTGTWSIVTLDLGVVAAGTQVEFAFAFDSVDQYKNNYEGWYVDDVSLRATVDAYETAATWLYQPGGDALSAWATGDITGDGRGDFLLLHQDQPHGGFDPNAPWDGYIAASPASGAPLPLGNVETLPVVTLGTGMFSPRITPAGDLDGDGIGDFVATATANASLVHGSPTGAFAAHYLPAIVPGGTTPFGALGVFALGDISSDGLGDLGAFIAIPSESADETGQVLWRYAFGIFLGRPGKDWTETGAFDQPDMVVEPSRGETVGQTDAPLSRWLVRLGDVNGDGVADFGLADRFGGGSHVFFGRAVTESTPPATLPPRPYQYTLATPELSPSTTPQGLDINDPAAGDVSQADRLQGGAAGDRLAGSMNAGDFNDDGHDDLLVWSDNHAYLLLGPVQVSGSEDVATRAEVRIDLAGLGVPVAAADIDGDGLADLVFSWSVSSAGLSWYMPSVLYGRSDLPRDMGQADARQILDLGILNDRNSDVHVQTLNWDGDGQADLLMVFEKPRGSDDLAALIFSGVDIAAGAPIEEGDAVLRLYDGGDSTALMAGQMFGGAAGYSVVAATPGPLRAAAADLDGDALDELVLARSSVAVAQYDGRAIGEIGRVYVLYGGVTGSAYLGDGGDALPVVQDYFLGAGVTFLGDLNRDGFGDFAATTTREDGSLATGSVRVFYGSQDMVDGWDWQTPLRASDAAVTISRATGSLPAGTWIEGPMQVVSGDFDGDGRADLAVSQPYSQVTDGSYVLDRQDRGLLHVVWSVAHLGPQVSLVLAPTDLDSDGLFDVAGLRGAANGDRFGTLSVIGRAGNSDGDRYDDLWVGAPDANVAGQSLLADAGKVYFLPGSPRRIDLGDAVTEATILTNETYPGFGYAVVAESSGRPTLFTDGSYGGDLFVLSAGQQERWYTFTTVGDGLPDNSIRVLMPAYDQRTVGIDTATGYISRLSGGIEDFAGSEEGGSSVGDVQVGSLYDYVGILELDLGRFLEEQLRPDGIESVMLQLDALVQAELGFYDMEGFTVVGSSAYFFASTTDALWQLVCTDGTRTGTHVIRFAGEAAYPYALTPYRGGVLFVAADDERGQELWFSDGTEEGTRRLSDINPGIGGAAIRNVTAFGNYAYFEANANDGNGPQVYRVVWGHAGPIIQQVTSVAGGFSTGSIRATSTHLFISRSRGLVGGKVRYELWAVPSAASAPELLRAFDFNLGMPADPMAHSAALADGRVVFVGAAAYYQQPFVSDGTVSGTVQLASLGVTGSNPRAFVSTGSKVLFIANGRKIYVTDGTPGNATFVADTFSASASGAPLAVRSGANVYFLTEGIDTSASLIRLLRVDASGSSPVVASTADWAKGQWTYGNLGVLNGEAVFTLRNTAGWPTLSELWVSDADRTSRLVYAGRYAALDGPVGVLGSQVFFRSYSPDQNYMAVWVADGWTARPLAQTEPLAGTLRVEVLAEEGDGAVTLRDAGAAWSHVVEVDLATATDRQRLSADLTDAVKAALAAGYKRLTLRLVADEGFTIGVAPFDADADTGPLITRPHGVLFDVVDSRGGVLYQGLGGTDMRWLPAGQYYLRVYDPDGPAATDVAFSIEIAAPAQRQARAATDMDRLYGDEGDDLLIGNSQRDMLVGGGGHDTFVGETVEVRDRQADERLLAPAAGEWLLQSPPAVIDPLVGDQFTDSALIEAVAAALGVPVVHTADGARFLLPLRAGDLNTLTRLDLAGLDIESLEGLQYARNLLSLNLASLDLAGLLGPLEPGMAGVNLPEGAPVPPDANTQIGLAKLRYLSLDSTGIGDEDLEALELLANLLVFSAADNSLTDVSALHLMTDLGYVDLSGNAIRSIAVLGGMRDLRYARLAGNDILDIGPLVGGYLVDDGDWYAGYSQSERWFRNIETTDVAWGGDYRFMAAEDGRTATWTFDEIPFGEYLVLATWHAHEGYATSALYVVNGGGDVRVDQTVAPAGPAYGGQAFQILGTYQPLDGSITVTLSSAGGAEPVDGTVIADAVLLLPLAGRPLAAVDLRGNALDAASHAIYLPLIEARAAADGGRVRVDPNDGGPVWTAPPEPQATDDAGAYNIPFISEMVDDPDGWNMLVGYSYSSELLWFTGGLEGQEAEYVRVAASTKPAGQTGYSNLRAGALSPFVAANGLAYLVDASRNLVSQIDVVSGRVLASQDASAPWDVAVLGSYVYVAADGWILRYDGRLNNMSYFLSLPPYVWGYLAPGADGNLYVGQQSYSVSSYNLVERVTPGGSRTTILDSAALDGMLLDLTADADGLLYALVGRFTPAGTYDCVVRVFNTSGVYQGLEFDVGTLGVDWARVPSVEIGPDDHLYVA